MGFNNVCILNLQHPTHNILSILVHNDHALEFTTKVHNVTKTDPISDFDPTDSIHLKDAKFSLFSPSLRAQKVKEVQNKRCLRGILFLRRNIRISVARFLCERELNSRNASAPPSVSLRARVLTPFFIIYIYIYYPCFPYISNNVNIKRLL
jgi:hypothetical protein